MVSPVIEEDMQPGVPVAEAEALGLKYDLNQVLIFTFNRKTGVTGITTWGADALDSAGAADGGNRMKKNWGWPENTIIEGAKVQKLYDRIRELETIIERAVEQHGDQFGNL